MKNKKGFTLIELLAVIVILAIIALIAVPIVLNMIEQAKKSAARSAALGYIDAIEYENGFVELEQEGYTKITSGDVSTINTTLGNHIKGKKPTSGSVTVDSNGKVTGATDLCFNGYKVNYNGQDVTVTKGCSGSSNNNQEPSIPEPVSFSTDSWETIANNTTSNKYHVGDTKTITMDVDGDNNSETYTLRIANNTTPNVCKTEGYSQTACGFVVEFVEVLEKRSMNSSRTCSGGWGASGLRTYLNGDFYNKLPSDLKNVIINTDPIVSGSCPFNDESLNTQGKIYLFSSREVGFDKGSFDSKNNVETDTRILDYYSLNNSQQAKIKFLLNGVSNTWWLRSGYNITVYDNNFLTVNEIGLDGSSVADLGQGVSPAFRIGVNQ